MIPGNRGWLEGVEFHSKQSVQVYEIDKTKAKQMLFTLCQDSFEQGFEAPSVEADKLLRLAIIP